MIQGKRDGWYFKLDKSNKLFNFGIFLKDEEWEIIEFSYDKQIQRVTQGGINGQKYEGSQAKAVGELLKCKYKD